MKPRLLLLVLTCALVGADDPKEDAAKKDLDALRGTWKMASLEIEGTLVPAEKLTTSTLTIKGDKYIIKVNDQTFETTMKLDPTKKPKTIDMTFLDGANKDKTALGIYDLDGDTFKMCRARSPGTDRPGEFGTWPNSDTFLVVWKKQAK
jgi:uncharacterized protein (TIGR03067 family)